MDEIKIQQKIDKGRRGQTLLENPDFKDALKEMRDKVHLQWESSTSQDSESRERLWWLIAAITMLEKTVEGWVMDGKVTEANLENYKNQTQGIK